MVLRPEDLKPLTLPKNIEDVVDNALKHANDHNQWPATVDANLIPHQFKSVLIKTYDDAGWCVSYNGDQRESYYSFNRKNVSQNERSKSGDAFWWKDQ